MIVVDNYFNSCDTLCAVRDWRNSDNLGSAIEQCITYGTVTGKHKCSDGRSSGALDDDGRSVWNVETSTRDYCLPFRNCIHDGIGICNFWVLHWSGTQALSLYKETLSDFVLCPRHPRYNNTFTIPD